MTSTAPARSVTNHPVPTDSGLILLIILWRGFGIPRLFAVLGTLATMLGTRSSPASSSAAVCSQASLAPLHVTRTAPLVDMVIESGDHQFGISVQGHL